MSADVLQTFKVTEPKVKVRCNVTYQQYKRYNSGTDRMTEFTLGENYLSTESNFQTCSRSLGQIDRN